MASVRRIIVGWCAAWLACISVPAEAQRARAPLTEMPVRIDGIDVEEVARLDPGTRLSFSVFGTPGAVASLQIEGARHGLVLREAERGVYEGTYTIEPDERIAANAPVVATLRRGAEVAQSVLDEPLVLGAAMPDGRTASARAAPVAEPRPAEVAPPPRSSAPTRPLQRNVACTDCAVVESVRAVETDGRNGVAGAVAGGLLGAILGHQIGHSNAMATTTANHSSSAGTCAPTAVRRGGRSGVEPIAVVMAGRSDGRRWPLARSAGQSGESSRDVRAVMTGGTRIRSPTRTGGGAS